VEGEERTPPPPPFFHPPFLSEKRGRRSPPSERGIPPSSSTVLSPEPFFFLSFRSFLGRTLLRPPPPPPFSLRKIAFPSSVPPFFPHLGKRVTCAALPSPKEKDRWKTLFFFHLFPLFEKREDFSPRVHEERRLFFPPLFFFSSCREDSVPCLSLLSLRPGKKTPLSQFSFPLSGRKEEPPFLSLLMIGKPLLRRSFFYVYLGFAIVSLSSLTREY